MDFVILKVNGQDLRNATHEQAIHAFQTAKEPIIVEVARRDPNVELLQKSAPNSNSGPVNSLDNQNKCSIAIQTDPSTAEATLAAMAAAALTTEDIRTALGIRHPGLPTSLECIYHPEFPDLVDIVEEDDDDDDEDDDDIDEDDDVDIDGDDDEVDEQDNNNNDRIKDAITSPNVNCDPRSVNCPCFSNDNIEYDEISDIQNKSITSQEGNEGIIWDMEFNQSENILIKEVTLCRKKPDEKFGLTLCYRQGDTCDTSCNVYVGELEYDSLAAQCGQIINGDQILGINGKRIKSREHVIDLFQQSKTKVTLLIARDKCITLKENTLININSPITKTFNTIQSNNKLKNESINEFDTNNELSISTINKNCTDYPVYKRPDQDSGMGRTTDESARTEESSEQEIDNDQHHHHHQHQQQQRTNFIHGLAQMTKLTCENDQLNNISSGNLLSQDATSLDHRLTIPSDVFSDYDPIDPIDQELVQLGRLMQSLAVHCRQLVQAKLQYNRIQYPLSIVDNCASRYEGNDSIVQPKTMSTKVITSTAASGINSPSIPTAATITTSSSSSLSSKISNQPTENCYYSTGNNNLQNTKCIISKSNEGISNGSPLLSTKDNSHNMSTRLPRMGTRMEPSIMGSISSNDSSGSFHDKNLKMSAITTTGKLSHSRFPSNIRDRPVSSECHESQAQQQQSTYCPDSNSKLIEPDSIYPDNLEQSRLNGSGDTSAYCTSESRKSQNDSPMNNTHNFANNSNDIINNNNSINNNDHGTSNGSFTDQRFHCITTDGNNNNNSNTQYPPVTTLPNSDYPTRTIGSLHYNGNSVGEGIAASLSDLGGSLLSLSAVIPDPHHYHHHRHHSRHQYNSSEVNSTNHHITPNDSFSPSSNWSIDGNSQYTTHSNNNNQYIHPDPNINYTESYYTSIRQFNSPEPSTSTSSSLISGRNHNKSSNEQLPSTSDNNINHNLQVNNSFNYNNANPLNEQKRNMNFAKDVSIKSSTKVQKSNFYHHQQHQHHQKLPNSNLISEHNPEKFLKEEKSPLLINQYKNKQLHFNQLYPLPIYCNEYYYPIKYISPRECITTTLNEKLSNNNNNNIMTTMTINKTIPSINISNNKLHSYEFYDNFSCSLTNKKIFNTNKQKHLTIQSTTINQPFIPFNELINMNKINIINEEPILSDIYETPYASVTIHDEPIGDQYPMKCISTDPCNSIPEMSMNRTEDCSNLLPKPNYWSSVPINNNNNSSYTQYIADHAELIKMKTENSSHSRLFNPYLSSIGYLDCITNNPLVYPHPVYTSATCHSKQYQNTAVNASVITGAVSSSSSAAATSTTTSTGMLPSGQVYPMDNWNMMEWVVKKRPDGTRYITRRPIRSRILKERAKRVAEERSGITTDDDAMSELKTGRYWNRSERKKQLEKARADRKRKQLNTITRQNSQDPNNELKLSHKNLSIISNSCSTSKNGNTTLVTMTTV
ncbi:unnamed protein product [Schistosoma spindalis]|nr:unnamed protein product [Schistosoma spindale]